MSYDMEDLYAHVSCSFACLFLSSQNITSALRKPDLTSFFDGSQILGDNSLPAHTRHAQSSADAPNLNTPTPTNLCPIDEVVEDAEFLEVAGFSIDLGT
jgi:hypothetical protein